MEKYINQIVAIDTILSNPPDAHYPVWFVEQIGNLPAADVIEVVHGEWKVNVGMNYNEERICCRCQKRIKSNHWNYCPNCGAKMDGGKEYDEDFQKEILYRTAYPENNINLLKAYGIPIPQGNPEDWSAADVTKIINRLKSIAKDIDWKEAILNGRTSEAIKFASLLEAIGGKRKMHELGRLVLNDW